jgi:hypothetical protein
LLSLHQEEHMIIPDPRLMRAALAIHDRMNSSRTTSPVCHLPTFVWHQCEALLRKLQTATDRGWHLAAERLQRDLLEMLRLLQEELAGTLHQLERNQLGTSLVSIRDLYADLLGLKQEFEEIKFAAGDETLSVTTESIELEGVHLGSFEICLEVGDWSKDASPDYRVIANEPQPATANEDVTHPHVQHEILCEGEGRNSLRQAWEQGRLYDFFLIVAHLLKTYNPASPYVALEDWFGVGRCVTQHMEQRGDAIKFLPEPEVADVSIGEIEAIGELAGQLAAADLCRIQHFLAEIVALGAVTHLAEQGGVDAAAAAQLQVGAGSRLEALDQPRNEFGFSLIVLLPVQQVVIT